MGRLESQIKRSLFAKASMALLLKRRNVNWISPLFACEFACVIALLSKVNVFVPKYFYEGSVFITPYHGSGFTYGRASKPFWPVENCVRGRRGGGT
jgi:hypothetical protein